MEDAALELSKSCWEEGKAFQSMELQEQRLEGGELDDS